MNILSCKKISGIYKIENTINGHCYIGSSVNIYARWRLHRSDLNSGKHHSIYLQRAWNLYGENSFIFSILEECNKNSLIEKEQFYFDSFSPEYNILKKAGSPLGIRHSDETKQKISKAKIGNTCAVKYMNSEEAKKKFSEIHKGKTVSTETRIKQSLAKIGRILSDITKEKMKLSARRGEKNNKAKLTSTQVAEIKARYIPRVVSQRDLAKEYGVHQSVIWAIVNNKIWRIE